MTGQDVSEKSLELVVGIVAAYISNNSLRSGELPSLIDDVHAALRKIATAPVEPSVRPLRPAVPARRSVTDNYIVCLEDGKKFKSLKRHLRTQHDMSPETYRSKWGLGHDYPVVAPNYARSRSQMAKDMGLGQRKRSKRT